MPSINKSQRNVVYKWLLFCMKAIGPDFHKLSDLQRAGVNKRVLLKPPDTKNKQRPILWIDYSCLSCQLYKAVISPVD